MYSQDGVPAAAADASQPLLLTISNEMVRIYKDQFGRGPTKVRTDWAGPDVLICTLRESFTPAERNLAQMGEFSRLRDTRMVFQYATRKGFVTAVEDIVHRKVTAFISGVDATVDVSAEIFYLEPAA